MAAPPAADPLEGMGDHRRQAAQSANTRYPRANVRKWGGSSKGYWRIAGSQVLGVALSNAYWEHLGLKSMTATRQRLNPTA
jgi:hypothetical protein